MTTQENASNGKTNSKPTHTLRKKIGYGKQTGMAKTEGSCQSIFLVLIFHFSILKDHPSYLLRGVFLASLS